MSLFIIFSSLALNIIYYIVSQKLKIRIFIKYFVGFIIYSVILLTIFLILEFEFSSKHIVPFLSLYILFFISLFLTISIKYIKSPTYLIFQSLKKGRTRSQIIKYLKKNKVLQIRIKDLENQNILEIKNGEMNLKDNLYLFINLFFLLKKFLNLKSEG